MAISWWFQKLIHIFMFNLVRKIALFFGSSRKRTITLLKEPIDSRRKHISTLSMNITTTCSISISSRLNIWVEISLQTEQGFMVCLSIHFTFKSLKLIGNGKNELNMFLWWWCVAYWANSVPLLSTCTSCTFLTLLSLCKVNFYKIYYCYHHNHYDYYKNILFTVILFVCHYIHII